ncbi:MAG: hypothetical protein J0M11_15430 [Anaerolineae bacterium]|nr:hypothetical protein [Anaerolineae bacterium]
MIFTFYSYKGGVGRSMALANLAELFYQEGLNVLMVDWDLEAPGLERYFPLNQNEALGNRGLLDLIISYKELMSKELKEEDSLNLEDPEKILINIYPKAKQKGKLQLLTAGQRLGDKFSNYSQSVTSFDWKDFYENWEGERYFEWLRKRFEAIADVVLIDSRTGVTEVGGVCTYQMADAVLMFCAPNHQSLHGTHEMATRLANPKLKDLRGGRSLKVIVIPSRVERSDSKLLDDFKIQFLETFNKMTFPLGFSAQVAWEIGITYVPKYALAELVAIREEREANLASAEILASEIRELGLTLEKFRKGDRGLLDYICNNVETKPDHVIFDEFGQLKELTFSNSKITNIPSELGQFTQLKVLTLGNIASSSLTTLPHEIGQLKELNSLSIQGTQANVLPPEISQLINLTSLDLRNNNLSELPEWLENLTELITLDLGRNNLSELPKWLAKLEHLEKLNLDGNPLKPSLQSAYDQGLNAVKTYLRTLEQAGEPLYEAKLVLVGEGNVGKTTLLKALKSGKGEGGPRKDEITTHGVEIDINGLKLPHPDQDGVEIQLNAWDFGGQDVYRITHQFFFSRRSLYLLVWEPRRGVQQGQVEDWLNMIRLRIGDDARVIIVATHCKTGERIARIDKPLFKQQYGDMIVGFHEVDSLVPDESTDEMTGIAELKKVIAAESAKLEQMGMRFNRDWKAARDELLALSEPRISFSTFSRICATHGLSDISTETLAHLMHDLGYIVHYADDEKLRDDVVLKPEWLTKAIGFVLENRATAEREGILPDGELYKIWHDHAFPNEPRYDPEYYPFFLRLMEKFGVCYRLTDGKASLVAQHVPQVRPELPWLPEQKPPKDMRRIAMVCSMEEDPPGLIPWMIVRTHDYAYPVNAHSLQWQKGMFLRHGPHGEALLEKRGREIHIYAQAVWPEFFMNVLHSTLEKLITDNWPGMKDRYRFMVPCPEIIKGEQCKGRFNIHALRQFLAEGDTHVRCQECSKRLSIAELLLGFEERDMSAQLREIQDQLNQAQKQISGLDSRIADYFLATMRSLADESKNGPRLFTLQASKVKPTKKKTLSQPLELQLWCEAEGCQHPVYDLGIYQIDKTPDWVNLLAPYANFVLSVLKTVSPIAAPAINATFGAKTAETWGIKDKLDQTKAILDKLPTAKEEHRSAKPTNVLTEPERSGILALHRLLNELDPNQENLGLHRVATYTGDFRWLCKRHYDAYQPNIPDVIEGRG